MQLFHFVSSRRQRVRLPALLCLFWALATGFLGAQEFEPRFRRGDANLDGQVDISDATATLSCLFLGGECTACPDAADANDDASVDVSDVVRVLNWLFLGGAVPEAPGPTSCGPDDTADRLPDCRYPATLCDDQDPTRVDIASRRHYAAVAEPAREDSEPPETQDERIVGDFRPREVVYDPRPTGAVAWNSREGRAALQRVIRLNVDLEAVEAHAHGSVEQQILSGANGPACTEPDFFVSAGDRQFSGWTGTKFQAPANAFPTEFEARQYLVKVQAEEPFFLPYAHPDVRLGQGWYYNSGGLHRACDYSRSGVATNTDPTFEVLSAGDGEVIATGWDGNGGNYVAIESTAPGGQKLMFIYLHLRDGRSNDRANALASTSNSEKYVKYRAFATNYPNHISWGSENHTIRVTVGDTVKAGEAIGWAGNTGAGGISAGLDEDGNPANWRGNTHLHVYVAAPHPTVSDTWVWVDPYGVYAKADSGCYDFLKQTQFSRIYAPYFPSFHGVPYEVLEYYAGYYPNMGYSLRTLSVHRRDNKLLASGSFQKGIPGAWGALAYLTPAEFQSAAEDLLDLGLIPRETSVERTLGGDPRYTAIWRPIQPGESFEHRAALTNAQLQSRWDSLVLGQEWRIDDYFGYTVGNTSYHSALFTSRQGRPFHFSGPVSAGTLDAMLDDMLDDGFVPVSFNVGSYSGTRLYSALFRSQPGAWRLSIGRSPAEYQALVELRLSQGYRIHKVQGYANSDRFGVLFHRAP